MNVPISPYRIDVQQGNALEQEAVEKLKLGMSRSQVRFLLGTPLLVDPFHGNRWDYVYNYRKAGKLTEQRRLVLFFEGDVLSRVEAEGLKVNPEPLAAKSSEPPKPVAEEGPTRALAAEPPLVAEPLPADASKAASPAPAEPSPAREPVPPAASPAPAAEPQAPPPAPASLAADEAAPIRNEAAPEVASPVAAKPEAATEPVAGPTPPPAPVVAPVAPEPANRTAPQPAPQAQSAAVETVAAEAAPAVSADKRSMDETSIVRPLRAKAGEPAPARKPAAVAETSPEPVALQPEADVEAIKPDVMPEFPDALPDTVSAESELTAALDAWAEAWRSRNEDAYLAAYAPTFRPAGGLSRSEWEARRRMLLRISRNIDLRIEGVTMESISEDRAQISFRQFYRSDTYRDAVRKQLKFVRIGGKWLIEEENVLGSIGAGR
ncbi:MAG: outer membrane protein assembly factor BamE [Pseudomonadota bacterium]